MLTANSEARLDAVHPELARRVRALAADLEAAGVFIQVTAGLRTAAEQDMLYALGRTLPGRIVTKARGAQSNHVIGCAVDVVPEDRDTLAPEWNPMHPDWARIVAFAPGRGLRSGKSWNDLPHLELEEVPPEPTDEIQQAYKEAGVAEVWKELAVPETA